MSTRLILLALLRSQAGRSALMSVRLKAERRYAEILRREERLSHPRNTYVRTR